MLNDAKVIVWAPDDFEPPTDEVWNWLLLWLEEPYTQRTLVYIGRDYDAGPEYSCAMRPKAPPAQQGEYRQRQLDVEGSLKNQRGVKLQRDTAGDLLTFQRDSRQQVKSLTGPGRRRWMLRKRSFFVTRGSIPIPTRHYSWAMRKMIPW